jgi:prepilin-type N-terminal cleavage/methylation domain-containing protein
LFPRGLTLIELLVTIVIMVTVLAGVIPMLSPNNDARKIREAARALSSMFAQAQAQAVRDGRPAGVAFRESDGNGIALEAFFINEPQPFAGMAPNSQVRFLLEDDPTTGYVDSIVTAVQFVLGGTLDPTATSTNDAYAFDPLPPRTFKFGDTITAGGFLFEITDPDQNGDGNDDTARSQDPFQRGDFYTDKPDNPRAQFQCTYIGENVFEPRAVMPHDPPSGVNPPVHGWTNPQPYVIRRQPANTSDEPLQFPRAIGIDLQGSGVDGMDLIPPHANSPPPPRRPVPTDRSFDTGGVDDVVGVMFGPSGRVTGFYFNGLKYPRIERVHLLVGKIESGNPTSGAGSRFDFSDVQDEQDSEVERRMREVNWTDPDSMWVTIATSSGRIVTNENRVIDVRDNETDRDGDEIVFNQDAGEQIHAARAFAEDLRGTGGR